jgi:hypothetical protein
VFGGIAVDVKDQSKNQSKATDMLITFIVAFSIIVYEIFLTRLFAVILDYNFVFLVISIATLGIGLGGYAAYQYFADFHVIRNKSVGLLALSLLAVVSLIYLLPFQGIWVYLLLGMIPFLLGGFILAGIMQSNHQNVHAIYFLDLVGAGLGAVGAIYLMNEWNPIRTIGFLTFILFAVYLFSRFRTLSNAIKLVHGVVLVLLIYNVVNPILQQFEFTSYRTSPYTAFYNQPDADIIFSQWNAFSRTDVFDARTPELLYMTIDGAAVSPISKFSRDFAEVEYLRQTTGYLAYQEQPNERALIIGVGSGQEVLMAKMAGFEEIEAVDINQGSFDAVHELFDFSGDVFNLEGVQAIVSDGRNYIRQTTNQYDLIYLSLVMKHSEQGLGLALTENFIFTQEAVADYMEKLTGQGRVAFLLHDEKELYKIIYAAEEYLREKGIPAEEIKNHMAVIGTYQHFGHVVDGMGGSKITRPLLLISKQPFEPSAAKSLHNTTAQIEQIIVHIPYVSDNYQGLTEMLQAENINVAANRDDQPFFYHKMKGIPQTLIIALLITAVFALFLAKHPALSLGQNLYFSGVAIGFMLIEVTLVQRLVLPLGHPTVSFVLVLGVLLVAGGMGSYFSKKWRIAREQRYLPFLLVALLAVGIHALIGWYIENPVSFLQENRVFWIGLLLFPLGFFMGMPFPYGLSQVKEHQTAMSWGFNGVMTVAGSLSAAALSIAFGFTVTMLVGAAIYFLLYVVHPYLKIGQ